MSWLVSRFVTASSQAIRTIGVALDNLGAKLEVAKFTEKLVPTTRFVAVNGVAPVIPNPETVFVAPNASMIGDVTLGMHSSVWYGATVRGDVNKVTIGENTSIGDRAVVHVARIQGNFPTIIGNHVTVGQGALVHAATLHNSCIIGEGAQVLDGSVVETHAIVEAGAVVTPGSIVPSGEVWAGAPARMVRALEEEEIAKIRERAMDTARLARKHAIETSKNYYQLADDMDWYIDDQERDHDTYMERLKEPSIDGDVLGQGAPGMVFDSVLSHPEEGLLYKHKKAQAKKKAKAAAKVARAAAPG